MAAMLFVVAGFAAVAPILDSRLLQTEAERMLRAQNEEKRTAGEDGSKELSLPSGPKRLKTQTQRSKKIAREADDE